MASPGYLRHRNSALQLCGAALRAPSSAVIRITPYTALVASVLAFLILLAQRIVQGGNPSSHDIAIGLGLVSFVSSIHIALGGLVRGWRRRPRSASSRLDQLSQWIDKSIPNYVALSLNTWLLLLLIPIFFSVWLSGYNRQEYFCDGCFGFMDKRGLIYGYLLTTSSFLVLPAFFKHLTHTCLKEPATWRDLLKTFVTAEVNSKSRAQSSPRSWILSFAVRLVKVSFAVALAAVFFAPPWHMNLAKNPIDIHETVHLGGLQAIHHGFLPYVGAASDHYGPGSQLLMYLYMKYSHQFTFLGFRETFMFIHWLAAMIFMVAVFLSFRFLLATMIAVIAVNLPPLTFFHFTYGGTIYGFFGWGNALRYLGGFLLLLLLPSVLTSDGANARAVITKGFGLGSIFGLFCYLSQENLFVGIISGLVLLAIGWLIQAYTTERLAHVVLGLALGFTAFWTPVLGFYAYHGQLLNFLDLYTLATRLFVHGYANTAYQNGLHDAWGKTYYFMPGFMLALGGLALHCPLRSHSQTKWCRERLSIVALALFCLVAHTGAMFRADSLHLVNTMIGLAVLVPCSVVYLPKLIAPASAAARWSWRLVIVVAFIMLLPIGYLWNQASSDLETMITARRLYGFRPDPVGPQVAGTTEAFQRVGTYLIDESPCCNYVPISMRSATELMAEIKNITGERATYVQPISYGMTPGYIYFFADLVPAPIYAERADMVINADLRNEFLKHFKQDIGAIQCIIASATQESPEIEVFKSAHPNYRIVKKELEHRPLYIFLGDTPQEDTKVDPKSTK